MADETQTISASLKNARESEVGQKLTKTQFSDAMAIIGITDRSISKDGRFVDKLTNFADAMAKSEKFDVLRAETMLRDLYKARYGLTMNERLQSLKDSEENLPKKAYQVALKKAEAIEGLIKDGETMPFYKAYDQVSDSLAKEFGITQLGAKKLIQSTFDKERKEDFFVWAKELEQKYHVPQREQKTPQKMQARKQARKRSRA